jgi:hypothetical protein
MAQLSSGIRHMGLRSTEIARIAYDSCNSLSQVLGNPPSGSYDKTTGEVREHYLKLVNKTIAQEEIIWADAPASAFVTQATNDPQLSKGCYAIVVALTNALAR